MMADLYDLCNLKGGIEKVCCSTTVSDIYPPSNLIQRNGSRQFMADYYIRAPVRLYFHIPSRVAASIVQISADTNVGEQTTSRVSILGSDEDIECCQGCQHNKTDGSKTNEEKDLYSRDKFTVLGKGEASNNHISFTNRRILPHDNSHSLGVKRDQNFTAITRPRIICINIVQTLGASIPCLKNLKILVRPNNPASKAFLDELKESSSKISSLNFFGSSQADENPPNEISAVIAQVPENKVTNEQDIPSEFLDEITHEIMQIPMVLPSGKLVDRSTIDKCNKSQSIYGGLPRDPFSGRVYTSNTKPVFNASLKSRIDEFVTQNKIEIHSGQTVGDARSIQEFLQNKHNPRKRKFLEEN